MGLRQVPFGILVLVSASAAAQTPVTTTNGGAMGTVPVLTGTSNIENSPIVVSASNIGNWTTQPWKNLSIGNGNNGSNLGLNGVAGTSYSFDFDSPRRNYLQLMSEQPGALPFVITGSGNVGIGTTTPSAPLEVNGSITMDGGGSLTFPDGTSIGSAAFLGNSGGSSSTVILASSLPTLVNATFGDSLTLNWAFDIRAQDYLRDRYWKHYYLLDQRLATLTTTGSERGQ
jgi:hypothetical protein